MIATAGGEPDLLTVIKNYVEFLLLRGGSASTGHFKSVRRGFRVHSYELQPMNT